MPGMPTTPPNDAEPPGFGLYEDGAEKPWGDLINLPSDPFAPPSSSTPPPITPWFGQGYEPEWTDNVNPMSLYYG